MPITSDAIPGPRTELARICIHCRQPVEPCACRVTDERKCSPPFRGLRHIGTASHLCSLMVPGVSAAQEGTS